MATENGTSGNDTLDGTTGADTLIGAKGNDTYIVNHLGDVVSEALESGTDTILTSVLDALNTYSLASWAYVENLTYTGTLAAQLKGNTESNVIKANSAVSVNDTLYGNGGNDKLYGYGGNDSMIGGSGSDTLDGGNGDDILVGGSGNDRFLLNSAADRVSEYNGGGFDTIESSVAKDLRVGWANYVEGLTYTGTTVATLYGNKQANLVVSKSATNDTLFGAEGNDTLDGGGGTDSMVGGTGNDTYMVSSLDLVKELANEGTDDTFMGSKTDISVAEYAKVIENIIYTGTSNVAVKGNDLDNLVHGGSGNDTVSGLLGDDALYGGDGRDSLVGGDGDDQLYGGGDAIPGLGYANVPDAVADTLAGGAGNDRYQIDDALDVVVETADGGTLDVVYAGVDASLARYDHVEALLLSDTGVPWFGEGSSRNDIIVGNQGENYLVGGSGDDTLSGTSASFYQSFVSDVIEGGAGNDVLMAYTYNYSSALDTSLFGGSGNDLYVLGYAEGYVGGLDTGGTDTAVLMGDASLEALDGVENIVLYGNGGANDTRALEALQAVYGVVYGGATYTGALGTASRATGNEIANRITGNQYNNILNGLAGNDTIESGLGNDTLDGGSGTDSLVGGDGADWYVVSGSDVVVEAVGQGFDVIASASLTSYAAYANVEGLQYTGSDDVSLNNGASNSTADYFGGGSGDDTLAGDGGADTLKGGDGKDSLNGGTGIDSLLGEAGNDSLLGGADGDYMDGGEGNDTVKGEAGGDNLYGGAGNDSVDGGADNDTLYGGDGTDTLTGGDGADWLYSAGNNYNRDTVKNTMAGGSGNDVLYGGDAGDTLSGDAGNDQIFGHAGNDKITAGGATGSTLYYQISGDVVYGDEQYGTGAAGSDTFILDAATTANAAVESYAGSGFFYFNSATFIGDFNAASDTIQLDNATVGDGDATIENVLVKDTVGGTFAANAELVIFRGDAFANFDNLYGMSYFTASSVTAAIGNASANFAVGAERIFVVDDGAGSAIFQFTAANADAVVSVDELLLLAVVANNTALAAADFVLG